jgi:GWxTD domain-containing protein
MVKNLILFLIFLLLPTLLLADVTQGGDILVQTDVARYKASQGYSYLEVYLSFPRDKFERKPVADTLQAEMEIRINIIKQDSMIVSQSWDMVDKSLTADQITSSQQIFDQYSTFLKEGEYKLKVIVRDKIGQIAGWVERDFLISPLPENDLYMSDIQFAYRIVPSREKNKFVKNGYYIFPNPGSIYGKETAMLYYYNEIYHLSPLASGTDSNYTVHVLLQDAEGHIVQDLPEKNKIRRGQSLVEVGQINLAPLSSGLYRLLIQVIDPAVPDTALQIRNFLVYSGEPLATSKQSDRAPDRSDAIEFSGSTEEELNEMYDKCRYIATKDENNVFKNLELEGKREFMANFWRRRDTDKSTPANEYMLDYFQRINISNIQFRSGNKEGWRTHRGRIYITYGEPNEIERFPSSMGERPYEIWHYHSLEGGVIFIFVDVSGFGEYLLVHSTSRYEVQDYGWQERYLLQ